MTEGRSSSFPPDLQRALEKSRQLYVATERKDGSLSSVSPIWFMYDGDAIYFTTAPTSFKAKRASAGRALHVRIGRKDGPAFVGRMSLVRDPALAERMRPLYRRRYWLAWLGFFVPSGKRVEAGKTVLVRVAPGR
jgi:hypothetical protein